MIHLDTHVLAWLYAGEVEEISSLGKNLLETEELFASPMAVLELGFLHEIGRIRVTGKEIVEDLASRIDLRVATTSFVLVTERAASLGWTRDPFDRLIVANALADGARLLTKDGTILKHVEEAIWEREKKRSRKRR